MITIVGDLIIDRYTTCEFVGENPEVHGGRKLRSAGSYDKLGGAAAVAEFAAQLGQRVLLGALTGDDGLGHWAAVELNKLRVRTELHRETGRLTTVKARFLVDGWLQPDRIDYETTHPANESSCKWLSHIHMDPESHGALAIADYRKGAVSDGVLRGLMRRAAQKGVPVVVDPAAGEPWHRYYGALLIKSNYKEATIELGSSLPSIVDMAKELSRKHTCRVVVTDGRHGMAWAVGSDAGFVPCLPVLGVDATCAGDAVLAFMSSTCHLPLPESCTLATEFVRSFLVRRVEDRNHAPD